MHRLVGLRTMLTLACQAEKAPLFDVISAEPVVKDVFDNEYMATYRYYYVYIKINVGTSDKPEAKTLIIDEYWNSRGPWKESKAPGHYTKWCPLDSNPF
jgi:hypothetical protein